MLQMQDADMTVHDPSADVRPAPPGSAEYPIAARLRNLIAMPFIYGLLAPLALLDAAASLYQAVCFRLWRIPRVQRFHYVVLARRELAYLNAVQRLNCAYCSYGNGVLNYAREIASRTEQYWCPIQHAVTPPGAHTRYPDFIPYGDRVDLEGRMARLRNAVQAAVPRQRATTAESRAVEPRS